MIFGDKSRFAISIDLDNDSGGQWLFGRFCYWISGAVVGDYDSGTSLRDVLFQMKYIAGDRGGRFCPALLELSADHALHVISDAINEGSGDFYNYVKNDFLPARLDVRIPVDIFDSWRIFLIDGCGGSRLLYGMIYSSGANALDLRYGEFDTIFGEAYSYLNMIYDKC
ncbi:Imm42 family immunity protein [Frateuria defendens]|uniref:Imm42 family immunity protein n=1 Tax=Frateuria defendens TaxID=2219559 RepID=UPI001F1D1D80|nr:Imm42 family immunity protein [Frateuria defendens]